MNSGLKVVDAIVASGREAGMALQPGGRRGCRSCIDSGRVSGYFIGYTRGWSGWPGAGRRRSVAGVVSATREAG